MAVEKDRRQEEIRHRRGLKNKGYNGTVRISAQRRGENMEISVYDSGSGFSAGKKAELDAMLANYSRQPAKLEGNSIGVLNVQKRIKLLCGREYGLSYTENEDGGVTAHLLLPVKMEEERWKSCASCLLTTK